MTQNDKYKILIVGAGLSGLVAGYELGKEIGEYADIKIIEKEKRIGGRILTKYFDGCPIELGAQFFVENGKVINLVKEIGLESNIITLNEDFLSFFYKDTIYPRDKLKDIDIICNNYKEIEKIFSHITSISPSNELILLNFEDWYKQNIGCELLKFWNSLLMSIGVKNIKSINALFGLILINVFFGKNYLLSLGLNKFVEKLEEKILSFNINICIETNCLSIKQNPDFIVVEYYKDNSVVKEKFDYIILAINPEELPKIKGLEKIKDISKICGHPMALYILNVKNNICKKTWGFININENSSIYAVCDWKNVLKVKDNSPILAICDPYADKNKILVDLRKMFPNEKDVNILYEKKWDVGLHQADKNLFLYQSVQKKFSNRIFFAGDCMDLPALEGALKSGFKASRSIINKMNFH